MTECNCQSCCCCVAELEEENAKLKEENHNLVWLLGQVRDKAEELLVTVNDELEEV